MLCKCRQSRKMTSMVKATVVAAMGICLAALLPLGDTTAHAARVTASSATDRQTPYLQLAQTQTSRSCPRGYVGRYPNCRRPQRPSTGSTKCPRGTIGKPPVCIKVSVKPPRKCPRGYVGWRPNCKRIQTTPNTGTKTATPKRPKRPKTTRPATRPKVKKRLTRQPRKRTTSPRRIVRTPAPRRSDGQTNRRPNEIVVMLDQSTDANAAFAIAQQYRLVRLQGRDINLLTTRLQRYRIPDRRSIEDVLRELEDDPRIQLSQPNYIYRLLDGTTGNKKTSRSRLQYALKTLQMTQAHTHAKGENVRIAVIDSGVDEKHAELATSISQTYNAVPHVAQRADAHGTAVAGIIGAGGTLKGMAPGARILAVRAFVRESKVAKPLTDSFILAHALDWAATNKAKILNLSFAGPDEPLIGEVIAAAQAAGMIVVAAAGNNGPDANPVFPAAYPGVIAVTATDKKDHLYDKANRGDYVTVAAPGVRILAPIPRGGFDFKSGTSFAAPHITGLIALMLERRPDLTATNIRAALSNTAVDLGPPGPDPMFGSGRTDALASLQAVIAGKLTEIARGVTPPTRAKRQ